MSSLHNLTIDGARLWNSIMETAAIGATPKGGLCRLTLTDLDRQIRDWFVDRCRSAGCSVRVDDLGNIFARRPGRDPGLAPIAMGSHLDTQPTGGKYDGVVGVMSALEVLRTLNDAGWETTAPLEIINWTNEEGSRFAPAMMGSGVFAGAFTKAFAYECRDREGHRFATELEKIGYKGDHVCGDHALSAFFEVHIEQGPILDAEGTDIGIVTGVQGMRWYEVTVTGAESHAGSTPMGMRRDALLGAARMVEAVNRQALAYAPAAVATVGLIEARPNSRNVIPGEVFFTIDLRHPEESTVAALDAALPRQLRSIADELGLGLDLRQIWASPAVRFDEGCVATVRAAADAAGFAARDIISGAGHDAAYVARVAPTAMIFVPCEKGISHNEAERAEPAHVSAGANVLLRAVLATDARLAEARKGGPAAG